VALWKEAREFFKKLRESLERDAHVSKKRCGGFFRKLRESLEKDAGVFLERCGNLWKEMRTYSA
jgi:hypothetical protein